MTTAAPQLTSARPRPTACTRQPARRQAAALREIAVARPYGFVQAKLTIGPANDRFEQQADAAADRVMRMADPQVLLSSGPTLSRRCAACQEEGREEHPLRREAAGGAMGAAAAPPIVHDVLNSPGRPLDQATHDFMASGFGADFSDVRIHTDAQAARSAAAVGARAYTVGSDVVFGASQYRPDQPEGRRLIAHELAHVTQQQHSAIRNTPLLQRESDEELDQTQQESEPENDAGEVHDGDSAVTVSPATAEPASEQESESPEEELALGEGAVPQEVPMRSDDTAEALDNTQQEVPAKKGVKKKDVKKKVPPKKISTIDVDQAKQSMKITWSDGSTENHAVSTGKGLPNTKGDPCKDQTEKNCTPNGNFTVGRRGDGQTKNSHGDKMSWYVEFVDDRDIGIHNSQPVPGVPASHGCVRVGDSKEDDALAKKINRNVVPGTSVIKVHGKAATKAWTKIVPKTKHKKK